MFKTLIKAGVVLALSLILFEAWVGSDRRYKPTPIVKDLAQQQLQPMTHMLTEKGELGGEGWKINAPFVVNNQEVQGSVVNALFVRNINVLAMQANQYQMFVLVPLQVGPLCSVKLQWFSMEDGVAHEVEKLACPQVMPASDTSIFSSEGIELDSGDLFLSFRPTSEDKWRFQVKH